MQIRQVEREIYLCTYMLTLCSGLSHYFPDAFSNKYVLPSVTELLKQRSLQHRSIAIALAHRSTQSQNFVRTNGRVRTRPSHHHQQVRRERPQSPPPPPRWAQAATPAAPAAWLASTSPSCVCSRHSRSIIKPCRKHWALTFENLLFQFGFVSKKCHILSIAFKTVIAVGTRRF